MPSLSSSDPPSTGPARILVALSDFERRSFVPQLADFDFSDALVCQYVTDDPQRPDWAGVVSDFRPTVVVSAWSTPAWSNGYLNDPGCPLRYICNVTGAVRWIASREFIARGGLVTNWGDTVAPTVAEHALLLTLAALRCQPAWRRFLDLPPEEQANNTFTIETRSLFGRTVSIHGFGRIARQFIRLLEPFRCRCRVYSENVPPAAVAASGATSCASLAELFEGAEILVECEALTQSTAGSVTGTLLGTLAPDAVFVNVGRGAVVDEAALASAAAGGRIRLGLDVFTKEPLPADSPLRQIPNAVLSPHLAGPTRDHMPLCGAFALTHLATYLRGETVPDLVTVEIFDRAT